MAKLFNVSCSSCALEFQLYEGGLRGSGAYHYAVFVCNNCGCFSNEWLEDKYVKQWLNESKLRKLWRKILLKEPPFLWAKDARDEPCLCKLCNKPKQLIDCVKPGQCTNNLEFMPCPSCQQKKLKVELQAMLD